MDNASIDTNSLNEMELVDGDSNEGPGTSSRDPDAREADYDKMVDPAQSTEGDDPNITGSQNPTEVRVSRWKHQSSYPMDNLVSPLYFGIQTRSKTKTLIACRALLSSIEPKNIREALKEADWVNSMQEELLQFERSKV